MVSNVDSKQNKNAVIKLNLSTNLYFQPSSRTVTQTIRHFIIFTKRHKAHNMLQKLTIINYQLIVNFQKVNY